MTVETATPDSAAKFDWERADDYAVQSRTALAGYDACHEVARACSRPLWAPARMRAFSLSASVDRDKRS